MNSKLAACAALIGISLFVFSNAFAADASFVGKWKFNPGKSQLNGLTYKVADAGGGQYTFVFGDDKETLGFDGKEHMTKYGNTWSIAKSGANSWHWVTKRDGKTINDATWTVSKEGATSTYVSAEMRPDGTTSKDSTQLKRTAGDNNAGLVGTWQSTVIKVGSPTTMEMATWQKDGYSMMNPTYKGQTDFKLDGNSYTPKGPRVAKGTRVSGKKIDDHNIQLIYKLKDKITEIDHWTLSANGKTLTDTVTYPGESKKEVDVYERQ